MWQSKFDNTRKQLKNFSNLIGALNTLIYTTCSMGLNELLSSKVIDLIEHNFREQNIHRFREQDASADKVFKSPNSSTILSDLGLNS